MFVTTIARYVGNDHIIIDEVKHQGTHVEGWVIWSRFFPCARFHMKFVGNITYLTIDKLNGSSIVSTQSQIGVVPTWDFGFF